jgi:hypothetical protein
MTADADLFWLYEYGDSVGLPASEVINLPLTELRGFIAYRKIKADLMDNS